MGLVKITDNRNAFFTTTNGQPFMHVGTTGASLPLGPWQEPAVGTFGDAARNSLRGPSFFDTDAAILKNITVSEKYVVQFRTDFLNVFNKVNLGLPSGCVDCVSTTGQQTGAVINGLANNASQRQLEFALRIQF